jgi:hypothetical protein
MSEQLRPLLALALIVLTNTFSNNTSSPIELRLNSVTCVSTITDKLWPRLIVQYAIDVESANGVIEQLLYLSPQRKLLYVTDSDEGKPSGTFEHLSCFFGGLLALGVATIPDLPPTHAWAAEGLTHSCWITYADQPSGLGRKFFA